MNTQEKQFNEKESLQLIQEMISHAKEGINDNGFFYLLWGWLVAAASITHYILLTLTDFAYPFISWPILMISGGIISGIYGARMDKKAIVKSYIDKFMGYLWGGFIISIAVVLAFAWKTGWEVTYPFIMILYGIGTFVSGGKNTAP